MATTKQYRYAPEGNRTPVNHPVFGHLEYGTKVDHPDAAKDPDFEPVKTAAKGPASKPSAAKKATAKKPASKSADTTNANAQTEQAQTEPATPVTGGPELVDDTTAERSDSDSPELAVA